MKIMTFRTEMSPDNERVPALLKALGVTLVEQREVTDAIADFYKMGVFTIEVDDKYTLESFRELMFNTIENGDEFVDMHRCWQTLCEGTKPDELWYMPKHEG